MADFNCPECGKALARKKNREGDRYFWGCTGYPDCKFIASDYQDEPLLNKCPECGQYLKGGNSKRDGRPYVACFNKEGHASGEAIFFRDDGTPKGSDDDRPKPKGSFSCPECGSPLKYFRIKNGKHAGEMAFGCFEKEKHPDGQSRYFDDNGGRPVM